jgi:hypothetical protein
MRDRSSPGRHLPPLLRLLLRHAVVGGIAAGVATALLIATDTAGLGTLVRRADQPWLAAGLLFVGFWWTLGALAMAAAIMKLGD